MPMPHAIAPANGTDEPRVAVVILNWRRPDDTMTCLRSVLDQDYPPVDLFVCDNASGDGSIDRLEAAITAELAARGNDRWRLARIDDPDGALPPLPAAHEPRRLWLVATGRNGGYAYGNNVGLALALRDPAIAYLWVLNNDTQVDAQALRRLVARMEEDPSIGLCGAVVRYRGAAGGGRIQAVGGGHFLADRGRCEQIGENWPADTAIDTAAIEARLSYVNGAAVLARRTMIDRVGLMTEDHFLYWEEMDWATRMARDGRYRPGLAAGALVFHDVGASTGSNDHGFASPSSTFWMTRSRLRFLARYHPRLVPLVLMLIARAALREVAGRRWERAGAMVRGAWAARRAL